MATSGTFTFNPSLGDFVTNAFAKCGVRRTELTTQHMQDANFEANLDRVKGDVTLVVEELLDRVLPGSGMKHKKRK